MLVYCLPSVYELGSLQLKRRIFATQNSIASVTSQPSPANNLVSLIITDSTGVHYHRPQHRVIHAEHMQPQLLADQPGKDMGAETALFCFEYESSDTLQSDDIKA